MIDEATTNESALGTTAGSDRDRLAALVRELAVVHGRVTLSSGKEADYYVDLRRATLHHDAGPLIGKLLRELVADWDFDAVGGLTMGGRPGAGGGVGRPRGGGGPRGGAGDRGG